MPTTVPTTTTAVIVFRLSFPYFFWRAWGGEVGGGSFLLSPDTAHSINHPLLYQRDDAVLVSSIVHTT